MTEERVLYETRNNVAQMECLSGALKAMHDPERDAEELRELVETQGRVIARLRAEARTEAGWLEEISGLRAEVEHWRAKAEHLAELEALIAELVTPYDAGVSWHGADYACQYCNAKQAWFSHATRFQHAEGCPVVRGREL